MENALIIHWGNAAALKLILVSSLLFPGIMGRADLYQAFSKMAGPYIVSLAPFAALAYILYLVSGLQ